MNKLIFFLLVVMGLMAQNPPDARVAEKAAASKAADPAQGEEQARADYWKALAQANSMEAAFRNSLSDQQKSMELQRNQFAQKVMAARTRIEAACKAKKQVLDPNTLECAEAAGAAEEGEKK